MVRILAGLLGAGFCVAAYASLIERRWFALRTHRVPCLPPSAAPVRILHISDLHFRAGQRKKARFLARCASVQPDLVVSTGDFLGDPRSVPATLAAVEPLRGRLGSIYVLGSNDYYSPVPRNPLRYLWGPSQLRTKPTENPWRDLIAGLQERGWILLANHTVSIDGIDIVGFDDPHIGRADVSVASARTGPGFRLAIAHSPDVARELEALGYDLIVTGHTHGGQVRIPGYGAIVTNTRGLPRAMARGLHRLGRSWLHVSAGLGTGMYSPYRFACRPEVCVLDLIPAAPEATPARPAVGGASA